MISQDRLQAWVWRCVQTRKMSSIVDRQPFSETGSTCASLIPAVFHAAMTLIEYVGQFYNAYQKSVMSERKKAKGKPTQRMTLKS